MIYSHEVEMMCPVAQGANHGPAPIPEEQNGYRQRIKDISGLTHGVAGVLLSREHVSCTHVKEGIIQEALVETIDAPV